MKKLLTVFLALLLSAMLPLTLAVGEQTMFYLLKEDGTVEITSYTGSESVLVLPSFRGFPVTSIGYSAFYNCTTLTSVTIPDSITSIENRAFYGCRSLTSISIPDSVTHIGSAAFANCTSLTSAAIPDGVTTIKESLFYHCSSLTSVTIPDSVTHIEREAFAWCTSLTSVTLPPRITSIGDHLFSECESLTSITIPTGVTSIGNEAFCGCDSLTNITVPDGVTSIGFQAFAGSKSLKSVTLPDSVTSIGYGAFAWCDSLSSITLPSGITAIEQRVFDGCYALTSVTIPDSVSSIGAEAFNRCPFLTLTVGCGSYAMQYAIENGCDYVVSVESHRIGLDHTCAHCDYSLPSPDTGTAFIHDDSDGDTKCDLCAADMVDALRYHYNTMFSLDRFNVPASIFDSSRICKAVFLNDRMAASIPYDELVADFEALGLGDEIEYSLGDDGKTQYWAGHSAILLIDENGSGLLFETGPYAYFDDPIENSGIAAGLNKVSVYLSPQDVTALLKGSSASSSTAGGGYIDTLGKIGWYTSSAGSFERWDNAAVFIVDHSHGAAMFFRVREVFEDEWGYLLTLHDCDHYALVILLAGLDGADKAAISTCNSLTPNGTYMKIEKYVNWRNVDHMYIHDWK